MTSNIASRLRANLGLAGLVISILGFAVALVMTIGQANLHFRRAEIAQEQFAAILRIDRSIAANDISGTTKALSRFSWLVNYEERALPSVDHSAQSREVEMAIRLAALVPRAKMSSARAEISQIINATIARESQEASTERQSMAKLRVRVWWLTAALLLAAIGSAALGWAGLLGANRRLAREVERRTAKLTEVDAARRLFFAKASHELRTPVTVMRGEAEVALLQPGAEAEALHQVVAQADFLEHRIAELLALAQAEDGQLQLHFAVAELGATAAEAVAAVRSYAAVNAILVDLELTDKATFEVDRRWLKQAIIAILDNAIKFSNVGGVVNVRVAGGSITVTDRGIGLMPDTIPRIFDAFYHADEESRGGSGLGLALARWVVEQHGGTIAATNLDAGGCRISIDLKPNE